MKKSIYSRFLEFPIILENNSPPLHFSKNIRPTSCNICKRENRENSPSIVHKNDVSFSEGFSL